VFFFFFVTDINIDLFRVSCHYELRTDGLWPWPI